MESIQDFILDRRGEGAIGRSIPVADGSYEVSIMKSSADTSNVQVYYFPDVGFGWDVDAGFGWDVDVAVMNLSFNKAINLFRDLTQFIIDQKPNRELMKKQLLTEVA